MNTGPHTSEPAIDTDRDRIVRECRSLAARYPDRVYRVIQTWSNPPSVCVVLQIGAQAAAERRAQTNADPFVIVDRWNPGTPQHDPFVLSNDPQPMQFVRDISKAATFPTWEAAETHYRTCYFHTSSIVRLSTVKEHMTCVAN